MNRRTPFFIFGIALALCFIALAPARAQELSVSVQPTAVDERLNPGESVSGALTITNRSPTEQEFTFSVESVAAVDETGRPVFNNEPIPSEDDISSWVKLSQGKITIPAGQSANVGYTITVPQSASPGGHFGGIFVDRDADPNNQTGASIGFKVGSLLSIHVNGDVVESVTFTEFASKRLVYFSPEAAFSMTVQNDGTVMERPRGFVSVKTMFGADAGSVTVNDGAGAVLPGSERVYEAAWAGEGFHLGKYTAVATLSYGIDSKTSITRQNTFWIIPAKPLGIALGVAIIGFLILWMVLRMSVKRALKRAGMPTTRKGEVLSAPPTFGARLAKTMVIVLTIALLALMALFILMA